MKSHNRKPLSVLGGTLHSNDENLPPPSPLSRKLNEPTHRPPSSPPTSFPFPISPPRNLPLRIPAQEPILAALDRFYYSTAHPILDTAQMLGRGGVGKGVASAGEVLVEGMTDGWGNMYLEMQRGEGVAEGKKNCEAMKVLERHIQQRMPYVQAASRRLQAVMGLRNETVFGELSGVFLSSG